MGFSLTDLHADGNRPHCLTGERKSLSIRESAEQFGIECAGLTLVIKG